MFVLLSFRQGLLFLDVQPLHGTRTFFGCASTLPRRPRCSLVSSAMSQTRSGTSSLRRPKVFNPVVRACTCQHFIWVTDDRIRRHVFLERQQVVLHQVEEQDNNQPLPSLCCSKHVPVAATGRIGDAFEHRSCCRTHLSLRSRLLPQVPFAWTRQRSLT